jgi:hypothetical protein
MDAGNGVTDMNSWDVLAISGALMLVMFRLERLGRQLMAVSYVIREELQTDGERKDQLMREWEEDKKDSSHWTLGLMWGLVIAWFFLRRTPFPWPS